MQRAVARVRWCIRERFGFAVMTKSTQPKTWVRAVNGVVALALAVFVVGSYWPVVKTFDLHRADLGVKGEWIGDHARRVTAVTPGGAADRAGLRPGDVLEFDPNRNDDWVLASYRDMPEGFTGTLPVRHPDGGQGVVNLVPERVAYLPRTLDRVALTLTLCTMTLVSLFLALLVWMHPSVMTWSLFLVGIAAAPFPAWVPYYRAFVAGSGSDLWSYLACTWALMPAIVPFGLSFPHDTVQGLSRWQRALGLLLGLGVTGCLAAALHLEPFVAAPYASVAQLTWAPLALLAGAALLRTYRRSGLQDRARLKWAVLGLIASLLASTASLLLAVFLSVPAGGLSGSALTPHYLMGVAFSVIWVLSIGYAVLHHRVVDIQFAISRTVVYGLVSTIVLVFLAVLHWLLGRMIEHSGFAFGVEGLVAVGLGLVLHRASHGINTTVDRVLFRKHHAAEERLRQVTAALPFAGTEQSIAEAIVIEPTRNLELASAALFYRESSEGPLKRVLAVGWGESHAAMLDAESLLVRYLQAEHAALRLDGEQQWLPAGMPEGVGHPVLAVPVVTQHELAAVVLYGAHVNSTLPDPDEVVLLEALAKAAAASHQQVRIATLMREKVEAQREAEARQARIEEQQKRIGDLEASSAELREFVRVRLSRVQGAEAP